MAISGTYVRTYTTESRDVTDFLLEFGKHWVLDRDGRSKGKTNFELNPRDELCLELDQADKTEGRMPVAFTMQPVNG